MDRWEGSLNASTGLIVEKRPCRQDPQQESGAHSHLQSRSRYEVGGEVPGRSLGGKILSGPLTLPR
jgi:hypothetical protein